MCCLLFQTIQELPFLIVCLYKVESCSLMRGASRSLMRGASPRRCSEQCGVDEVCVCAVCACVCGGGALQTERMDLDGRGA